MTQGGQIPGQPGLIHRRHDAGEARDGGDARNRSTGHGSRRGWHRWNPEPRPRPLVLVGSPETAQIDGGVHFRGGRSSAKCGRGAAAHRWVNGGARQHLKAAGACRSCYARQRCSGHGARQPWRTAASGARGAAATGRAREREVRGNDGKLTGRQQGGSVGSGTRQTSRIDGGELRWPATETAMVAALQGVRRGMG